LFESGANTIDSGSVPNSSSIQSNEPLQKHDHKS